MTAYPSRREFLGTVVMGTALWPGLANAASEGRGTAQAAGEPLWDDVRRQFSFREEAVPMNAANLCPSARVVADRVAELTRDVDVDCSSPNRRKFGALLEESRAQVARQLRVTADEVALVRNTSEANNIINNGLPLGPGDEVVLWDQNHPTNNVAWEVRGARFGITVTKVSTPAAPTGVDELVGVFERALTPRTRVLALTHISNTTGVRLPIRELCAIARRRGIYVHLDGAQSWGVLDLNLRELGCDSYAASAHKWFCGPREVGLLFVRAEHVDTIWAGVIGASWGGQVEPRPDGARKFESFGQRDDAALAAIGIGVEFHDRIGLARTEARVVDLATRLKTGLRDAGYDLVTPMAPALSGGVCIAAVDAESRRRIVAGLYEEHGIAGATTGGLRLSPHLYNTHAHIARAVEGARVLRRKERG